MVRFADNIEANFYGCGSSNHLELMEPYFDTIYSLHADCAARAASPDWSVPGHAPVPSLGPNTYGFECGHHAHNGNSNDNGCPRSLGNFSGIALVNGIGPLLLLFLCVYQDHHMLPSSSCDWP